MYTHREKKMHLYFDLHPKLVKFKGVYCILLLNTSILSNVNEETRQLEEKLMKI